MYIINDKRAMENNINEWNKRIEHLYESFNLIVLYILHSWKTYTKLLTLFFFFDRGRLNALGQ